MEAFTRTFAFQMVYGTRIVPLREAFERTPKPTLAEEPFFNRTEALGKAMDELLLLAEKMIVRQLEQALKGWKCECGCTQRRKIAYKRTEMEMQATSEMSLRLDYVFVCADCSKPYTDTELHDAMKRGEWHLPFEKGAI